MIDTELTFLLTDIEGSVRLWARFPDEEMFRVIAEHHAVLIGLVENHGGTVFKDTGDGMWASFPRAGSAADCAVAAQRAMAEHTWGEIGALRVRMALHRGFTLPRGDDHCGQTINLTARLLSLAHGGQVLATQDVMVGLEADQASPDVSFIDVGRHHLRDFPDPVHVHQLLHPGITSDTRLVVEAPEQRPALAEPPRALRGRDADVSAIVQHFDRADLVTITGAAGLGKTRLATRIANLERHRYLGGCLLIEPSGESERSLLLDIASALGLYRQPSESLLDIIVDFLNEKPTFLLIDGLEGVQDAARSVLPAIINQCPEAKILVTSTELLGVQEERVYELSPLSLTNDNGTPAAVELLRDIAVEHGAHNGLEDEDNLIRLCRAVDGVPLAIELLAAHVAMQRPDVLLDGLTAIDTAAPLRSVLQDSVDRLSAPAKELLYELSLFAGPFALATIENVSGTELAESTPQLLAELRRHSLLAQTRVDAPEVWFRILEPIRRFLRESADFVDGAERRARHARAIIAQASTHAQAARGRDEELWVDRLDAHFPDLSAAFDWALETMHFDLCEHLISTLWDFAHGQMRPDVWVWADRLLDAMDPVTAKPDILGVAALGAWMRGDGASAVHLAERAVAEEEVQGMRPSVPARLALLDAQSYATTVDGEVPDLTWAFADLFEETAEGPAYWAVNAYVVGAVGLSLLDESEAARGLADQGLTIARNAHNPSTLAWGLFGSAMANESRDEPLAEAYADEAVRVARSVGNLWVESIATGLLVTLRRRVAGGRAAAPLLVQLLSVWERTAHTAQQWHAIRAAGFALLQEGESEVGLELITAAQKASLAMPLLPSEQREIRAAMALVDDAVEDASKARAVARGSVVDLRGATRLARERLLVLSS